MKNSKMERVILIGSGLTAIAIGAGILFAPAAFHALNGIELGSNISLLSEIRAPGAGILASGLLILCGAFIYELSLTALIVATMLYLSYGVSRFYSMSIDGLPAQGLVIVAFFEIAIGLICAFALRQRIKNKSLTR